MLAGIEVELTLCVIRSVLLIILRVVAAIASDGVGLPLIFCNFVRGFTAIVEAAMLAVDFAYLVLRDIAEGIDLTLRGFTGGANTRNMVEPSGPTAALARRRWQVVIRRDWVSDFDPWCSFSLHCSPNCEVISSESSLWPL